MAHNWSAESGGGSGRHGSQPGATATHPGGVRETARTWPNMDSPRSPSEQRFASRYAKQAAERELAEKAKRDEAVAHRVRGLGSNLEAIRSVLEAKKKGRHDSIKVTLLQGRNLPIMDFRKSDPYVKFQFFQTTKQSTVKRGELNPTWDESFVFKIEDQNSELPPLTVDVLDEDLLPGTTQADDDMIGRVHVVLDGELEIARPIRRWYTLGDLGNAPSGPAGAEAQIELLIMYYGVEERKREKEAKLQKRLSRRIIGEKASQEADQKKAEDSKRIILVGHLGRMRNPDPEARRIAVQSISKVAGPQGIDLPSEQHTWAAKILQNFSERIEKDPIADVRLDALEALEHTTPRGIAAAVKASCTATRDSNKDVRLRAVKMIQNLAESGDEMAIHAVGGCLEDPDQLVRVAASQVLPKLSTEFDERLVRQALQGLTSMHAVVRRIAIQTLVSVTTKGSPVVVEGLINAIQDVDGDVKALAISQLAKQAGRGHRAAVQAVMKQLSDSRSRVRETAAAALAAMATKMDKAAIHSLVKTLQDASEDVYGHMGCQAAALMSIREISQADRSDDFSPRTRQKISEKVRMHLRSTDWRLRKEAITTLMRTVAVRSDQKLLLEKQEVLRILVELMEDDNTEVRLEALASLEAFGDELDHWVLSCVGCLLVQPSSEVRNAAASLFVKLMNVTLSKSESDLLNSIQQGKSPTHGEVIGLFKKIVARGDETYLSGFCMHMCHGLAPVRSLASEAIQTMCLPSQSFVVEAITKNLAHSSHDVKCDNILTLSKVVLKNDQRYVQIVQDMLKDSSVKVKRVVPLALENMLVPGDSRHTITMACVRLDSGYHDDMERKNALDQLAQLSKDASTYKVEGWSVEDADLERFWQQIQLPRGPSNDSSAYIPKILNSLRDNTAWVRRAGVEALMHCAKRGDPDVVEPVCQLLDDSTFAVRIGALGALAILSTPGDKRVIDPVLNRLNDFSHLVRKQTLDTLQKIVKVGDRLTARRLMSFLRNSWEFAKMRGNDTDIKEGVVYLLFHVLAYRDDSKLRFLLEAVRNSKIHLQRDGIEWIEDFLISQNLMTRYLGYAERLKRGVSPDALREQADASNFTLGQLLSIMKLQRRVIASRKAKAKGNEVRISKSAVQDEKEGQQERRPRAEPKKSFQERILQERVESKSRSKINRHAVASNGTTQAKQQEDASSTAATNTCEVRMYPSAPLRTSDWYKQADDADAEHIIRRYVPATVRSAAVGLAHSRYHNKELDAFGFRVPVWEKSRWTKRLRLCEEIHGAPF